MTEDYAVLYKFIRNDAESLNKGRANAQGGHASTDFVISMLLAEPGVVKESSLQMFHDWRNQSSTGTFGTEIVKEIDGRRLVSLLDAARDYGLVHGRVVDEDYGVRDGDITHKVEFLTCGYIFGMRSKVDPLVRQYDLY